MKINIALIFAAMMILQACGSRSGMMHSESSVNNNQLASVIINK